MFLRLYFKALGEFGHLKQKGEAPGKLTSASSTTST
jgi:hypothetical protein